MKPLFNVEHRIEDAVGWTIIMLAIVACALIIFVVGNTVNESLMSAGVL